MARARPFLSPRVRVHDAQITSGECDGRRSSVEFSVVIRTTRGPPDHLAACRFVRDNRQPTMRHGLGQPRWCRSWLSAAESRCCCPLWGPSCSSWRPSQSWLRGRPSHCSSALPASSRSPTSGLTRILLCLRAGPLGRGRHGLRGSEFRRGGGPGDVVRRHLGFGMGVPSAAHTSWSTCATRSSTWLDWGGSPAWRLTRTAGWSGSGHHRLQRAEGQLREPDRAATRGIRAVPRKTALTGELAPALVTAAIHTSPLG